MSDEENKFDGLAESVSTCRRYMYLEFQCYMLHIVFTPFKFIFGYISKLHQYADRVELASLFNSRYKYSIVRPVQGSTCNISKGSVFLMQ